jgi:hypothetical protein
MGPVRIACTTVQYLTVSLPDDEKCSTLPTGNRPLKIKARPWRDMLSAEWICNANSMLYAASFQEVPKKGPGERKYAKQRVVM